MCIPACHGAAVEFAILPAFLEFGPIFKIPVALRNSCIRFLDAPAQFGKQRIDQRLAPVHLRFEIGIFGAEILEHILVIDSGIAIVAQPVIRIRNGYAVPGKAMVALLGAWRLDAGIVIQGFNITFLGDCWERRSGAKRGGKPQ